MKKLIFIAFNILLFITVFALGISFLSRFQREEEEPIEIVRGTRVEPIQNGENYETDKEFWGEWIDIE